MPCRSDYMEPTEREKESKLVADLLLYVYWSIGETHPCSVSLACQSSYGDVKYLDDHTKDLCSKIKGMSEELLNKVVYDGRNPQARKLADWWDRHQLADAKREAEENQSALSQAMSKLTEKQLEAIRNYFGSIKDGQV